MYTYSYSYSYTYFESGTVFGLALVHSPLPGGLLTLPCVCSRCGGRVVFVGHVDLVVVLVWV